MRTDHRVAGWCPFPRSMVLWWYVPIIWRWLPWTRVPTIYYDDLESDPHLADHELGHVEDLWSRYPWWPRTRFYVPYLLSRRFRHRAEAYAMARRIVAMVETGKWSLDYLLDFYSRILSESYRVPFFWRWLPKTSKEQAHDLIFGAYLRRTSS